MFCRCSTEVPSSLVYLGCLFKRADFKAMASRARSDIFKQEFRLPPHRHCKHCQAALALLPCARYYQLHTWHAHYDVRRNLVKRSAQRFGILCGLENQTKIYLLTPDNPLTESFWVAARIGLFPVLKKFPPE